MAKLVARMDRVIILATPFGLRLQRMLARDGPGGLGRFLYNEFAWRRFVTCLFEDHPHVAWLEESELPEDPFGGQPRTGP